MACAARNTVRKLSVSSEFDSKGVTRLPRGSGFARTARATILRGRSMLYNVSQANLCGAAHDKVRQARERAKSAAHDKVRRAREGAKSVGHDMVRRKTWLEFLRRLRNISREEHTLISFAAPLEMEEAITNTQATQLFWTLLFVDLFTVALLFGVQDQSKENAVTGRDPGGTRKAAQAQQGGTPQADFTLSMEFSVTILIIEGLIAVSITFAVVCFCRAAFQWGNSLRRRRATAPLRTLLRRLFGLVPWRGRGAAVEHPLRPPPELRGRHLSGKLFDMRDAAAFKSQHGMGGAAPPQKSVELSVVAIEMLVSERLRTHRSAHEVFVRRTLAWAINITVALAAALISLSYAISFGERETERLLLGWGVAIGQVLFMIEPIQVFMLAGLPFLFNQDTQMGKTFGRVRTFYNEFVAP